MAEVFKNFNAVLNVSGNSMEIVPSGISGKTTSQILYNSDNYGLNSRTSNSIVQVHSLYICNAWSPTRLSGESRYTETNFKHVDLYIGDKSNTNFKIYVAHDIELVPGCPFYIEKNITLTPSQTLNIYAPTSGESGSANSSISINVTAAAIEFLSD